MSDFGITPEDAKQAIAGGFGASVLVYLRHPGSLFRAVYLIAIGFGIGYVFTPSVSSLTGFDPVAVASLLGLLGKAFAEGLLNNAEKFDVTGAIIKRIKP